MHRLLLVNEKVENKRIQVANELKIIQKSLISSISPELSTQTRVAKQTIMLTKLTN